jgi:hypothetical protein
MSASVGEVALLSGGATACRNAGDLADEVRRACERPVNPLQVAALLESVGVTEAVAAGRYGHRNVFELAETVQRLLPAAPARHRQVDAPAAESARETAVDYLRGPLALLPIVLLSFIIMVYQGFGQWETAQVLAMSLAMIGSLLVTSGFVQALSRKGSSYLSQGQVTAAKRMVGRILVAAMIAVLASAAAVAAALTASGWLTLSDVSLLAVTYVAMSILWLVAGVLFLLKRAPWFGLAIGAGLVISYVTLTGLGATGVGDGQVLLVATILGLAGILAVAVPVSRKALSLEMASFPGANQSVVLTPTPQLVVGLGPYFVYGMLYVAVILAGHVGGWVGAVRLPEGQFEALGTIEVALTVALSGYILAGGVAERTMRRFWQRVKWFQGSTNPLRPGAFSEQVERFFRHEQRTFWAALITCSLLVAGFVQALIMVSSRLGVVSLPWSEQSATVLAIGLVGYGLMATGIFRSMFMITLSRPRGAIIAASFGAAATLVSGLALAFLLPYEYATLSVVVGGAVFAAVARIHLGYILRDADFFYYASF